MIKNCNLPIPTPKQGLQKDVQTTEEAFSPQKRTSSLSNMILLNFSIFVSLLPFWIRIYWPHRIRIQSGSETLPGRGCIYFEPTNWMFCCWFRAQVSQQQLDQAMSGRRMINIYKLGESIIRWASCSWTRPCQGDGWSTSTGWERVLSGENQDQGHMRDILQRPERPSTAPSFGVKMAQQRKPFFFPGFRPYSFDTDPDPAV